MCGAPLPSGGPLCRCPASWTPAPVSRSTRICTSKRRTSRVRRICCKSCLGLSCRNRVYRSSLASFLVGRFLFFLWSTAEFAPLLHLANEFFLAPLRRSRLGALAAHQSSCLAHIGHTININL